MTIKEYIEARQSAGHRLHFNKGVWWETVRWGYCKPAILHEAADPVRQSPARWKSAIGYTHRVREGDPRSGEWHAMVMRQPAIENISLDTMTARRRRSIRKGIRLCQVEELQDLSAYRREMTDIAISTAIRNHRGFPPNHYIANNNQWWQSILTSSAYTVFWGVFYSGKMTAYFAVQFAGHRAIVDGVKSMTEFLHVSPNDAAVYSFLISCRERRTVHEIIYGHWSKDKPTLNEFKQGFGFMPDKIPYIRKMFFGLIKYPEAKLRGAKSSTTGDVLV